MGNQNNDCVQDTKKHISNLRDTIRGWREALGDNNEKVGETASKLLQIAATVGQKKMTKKAIAAELSKLAGILIDAHNETVAVGGDMYDAARGKINNYYQPKIIRRLSRMTV